MASLHLVQGPAGGGKSAVTRDMLAAGEIQLLADVTALWAALTGAVRGPDGRYPVRLPDDPGLRAALYLQATAAHHGLREGLDVAVTTSQRGQEPRWRAVADTEDAPLRVRTIDPGRSVVLARLAQDVTNAAGVTEPVVSAACRDAVNRWY